MTAYFIYQTGQQSVSSPCIECDEEIAQNIEIKGVLKHAIWGSNLVGVLLVTKLKHDELSDTQALIAPPY